MKRAIPNCCCPLVHVDYNSPLRTEANLAALSLLMHAAVAKQSSNAAMLAQVSGDASV